MKARLCLTRAAGLLAAAAVLVSANGSTAAPPTPASPPMSHTAFGDWVLRCQTPVGSAKLCEVAQEIAVRTPQPQKQPKLVAEVVFGRLSKTQPLFVVVQVPVGVWLPAGAALSADKMTPIRVTYTRCVQTCMAESGLTPANIAALKGLKGAGQLLVEDSGQHPAAFPISFKGLSEALAARDKALS